MITRCENEQKDRIDHADIVFLAFRSNVRPDERNCVDNKPDAFTTTMYKSSERDA
jgi:hypothetical protein